MKPEIVYGMSFEEYQARPGVSQSALKRLAESPLTYWTHSDMNPNRPPDEDKEHFAWGRAAHARILEGREAFQSRFCTSISRDDFPEYLASGAELKARCEELGVAKSGTLADMSARIRKADPDALLWVDKEIEHGQIVGNRTTLKPEVIRQIEVLASSITGDEETAALLSGGRAEVSVFWEWTSESGMLVIPCKARFDYLNAHRIVDLKKFANERGRTVQDAVAMSVVNYQYGIQAVMYREAYKACAKAGLVPDKEPEFTFIFIQSGVVPNVLARKFDPQFWNDKEEKFERSAYYGKAERDLNSLMLDFADCQWKYKGNPWVDPVKVLDFQDDDFPTYAL